MNDTALHFATHHLPVMGLVFGLGVLAIGRFKRNRATMRAGLRVLVVCGMIALPACLASELADGATAKSGGQMRAPAGEGEDPFDIALPSVALAGVMSSGALLLARRRQMAVAKVASFVVLFGAVGVASCMTWGAKLHAEGGPQPVLPPAAQQLASLSFHQAGADGHR